LFWDGVKQRDSNPVALGEVVFCFWGGDYCFWGGDGACLGIRRVCCWSAMMCGCDCCTMDTPLGMKMKLNRYENLLNYGWIAALVCIPVVVIVMLISGQRVDGITRSTGAPAIIVSSFYQPMTIDHSAQEEEPSRPIKAGDRVRIVMKDGQSFTGEFVSKDRLSVVIKIAGIRTSFDLEKVDRVTALKSFEEEYRDLKKSIATDDYAQRMDLCKWLYGRGKYELAAKELEALLDATSHFPEARQLLRTVNKAIELHANDNKGNTSTTPKASDTSKDGGNFIYGSLVSDDDVNLMRVYEVDLDDPPRMIFSRKVIDDLFKEYGSNDLLPKTEEAKRRFYSMKPSELLDIFFELQARDFYGRIRVLSEPKAFGLFRLDVDRTWLMNSCATSRCHGGPKGGKFYLFNKRVNDSRTVYSNFLILERTKIRGQGLLNYDKPEESLLLQMGLPRNQTAEPHPLVEGWRPVFRDRLDPLYQKAVSWMNAMYKPRPDYPVKFELPKVGEAGQAVGGEKEKGEAGDREGESQSKPTGVPTPTGKSTNSDDGGG